MVDVSPGTVVLFSDLGCPWASLAVHRLRTRRDALGLGDAVRVDHRPFPIELFNARPTPKRTLEAEVACIGAHEPALGWHVWQRPEWCYPVSTLLPMEAVQAAKAAQVGGLAASEQLDAALRHAFFADSRTITLWTEVLEIARGCPAVDADALEAALGGGAGRAAVLDGWRRAPGLGVRGSPHLFLPDGTDVHNPGLSLSWSDESGRGYVAITADDPTVYDDLLRRAAGT